MLAHDVHAVTTSAVAPCAVSTTSMCVLVNEFMHHLLVKLSKEMLSSYHPSRFAIEPHRVHDTSLCQV